MQLFERPQRGEKAILVHIDIGGSRSPEQWEEFRQLAVAAGAHIDCEISGRRPAPDAKYFMGSGKAEELRLAVEQHGSKLVLIDHVLSPAQERNLERLVKCRVLDRTGLILDIFAQRARSYEGKLQVELAQLRYLSSRLVRGWTHLERQRGGIGLRGPGETQLEIDRRLIGVRIKQLKKRLEKVEKQRQGQRRARQKSRLATVSVVGYTNAGKSTLFNALTRADVFAADQLFATLDPTLRRVQLSPTDALILADTVGFIRDLPHTLVAAFRATLEESREADMLLHVVDAADPERDERIEQVNAVLAEIAADAVPQLMVFNKIDLVEGAQARVDRDENGLPQRVWLSAVTGAGIALLKEVLAERLYHLPQAAQGEQRDVQADAVEVDLDVDSVARGQ